MSDSVDRVFVHALATVRRLPRTGSSRPPPAARLRLYGLYKQSMEGDVEAILPRPTLPPSSPDPSRIASNNGGTNNGSGNPNAVHRYASRDLRTREAQAEIEKWDAWHACAGMSRTEAKRRYISTLIETMKEYASGTAESRELVSELEFVWNQIKSQSGSDPEDETDRSNNGSGEGEKESPTRKLERAGLKQTSSFTTSGSAAVQSTSGSARATGGGGSSFFSRTRSDPVAKVRRSDSGLRVLSPVSQQDSDSIVEGIEEPAEDDENGGEEDDEEEEDLENLNTAPTSPIIRSSRPPASAAAVVPTHADANNTNPSLSPALSAWQSAIESHLRHLTTEIAALREQLSSNHLLSSSSYSHTYYTLNRRQRILHHVGLYLRALFRHAWKQGLFHLGVLAVCLVWGRWKGDLRLERWVRRKIRETASWARTLGRALFGRDGRLGWWLGRLLRIY